MIAIIVVLAAGLPADVRAMPMQMDLGGMSIQQHCPGCPQPVRSGTNPDEMPACQFLACGGAVRVARGRSCILDFRDETAWWHPMHLHGHSFTVLERAGVAVPHDQSGDTVLVRPREHVRVAFRRQSGDGMLPCHVMEHQVGGLMTTEGYAQYLDQNGFKVDVRPQPPCCRCCDSRCDRR